KEFFVYTVARLGIFVASYVIVAGIYVLVTGHLAVPLLWPFLAAIVISAIASVYFLKGPRARFAAKVEERATRATAAFEKVRAKEDQD
ncbi:DUF4229 domain-containing protein, partial [Mycobacterium sp.]|uniref:DUF4229 domain-containing protein n=1 Tax=Mycobacterium sp. TaxID=1785 RepID=UPI003D6C57FF